MPSWPETDFAMPAITPFSYEASGGLFANSITSQPAASPTWPVANTAYFIPFRLRQRCLIKQIVVGAGTGAGNFDVGIYDLFGNRLVSSTSTAKTTSAETPANITDTPLGRGVYYMAMASDGTTAFVAIAPTRIEMLKMGGVKEMTSAFPLPATATLVTLANSFMPQMALYRTSL